jgi:hypothetical protein
LHLTPFSDLIRLRPGDKLPEQSGVSLLGILSLPPFVAQVLEKIFNQVVQSDLRLGLFNPKN